MLSTILVPLDGSPLAERALLHVEALAPAAAVQLAPPRVAHPPAFPARMLGDPGEAVDVVTRAAMVPASARGADPGERQAPIHHLLGRLAEAEAEARAAPKPDLVGDAATRGAAAGGRRRCRRHQCRDVA
jgi:hypothetical protein